MKHILILVVVLVLAACGSPAPSSPSEGDIQTAIAQTVAAQPQPTEQPTLAATDTPPPVPTDTPKPTNTPEPTSTPLPSVTPTSTRSVEELQAEFCELTVNAFKNLPDLSNVNMCRFGNGLFEMEVKTAYLSRDNQPDVSYNLVQGIAYVLHDWTAENAAKLAGGDSLTFVLVTYSEGGDYRYQSDTTFATLMDVANKRITYEEWVATANAGFR